MQVGETSKFYRPAVRASPGRKNRFPGRRRGRARSRENQTFGFTGAGQLCYNEIHMGRRTAAPGLGGFRVRFQTAACGGPDTMLPRHGPGLDKKRPGSGRTAPKTGWAERKNTLWI